MYQALYRVWRPQRFEDIAGQEMISQTLKNAIVSRKVSHAYLFTGPRGTGKTSAAKIFAKAINCPNQKGGEPCNACEICQGITQGALGDIIEIDAASNNGVEEIRDIRDKSRYAPTQVTYKVYIIDEVHMLSTGAFNALLKTLEEPTENVIFILATTEPHKIPATIISRAQRFDFKRISMPQIQERLAYILEQEHITYEPKALHILAKSANGGMRDALSLLDQAISYGQEGVNYDDALQVSGSVSQEHMLNYIMNLYQQQTAQALMELQKVLNAGKEASRFVEELLLFSRDLLLAQAVPNQTELVDLMVELPEIQTTFIYTLIDELTKTQQVLRLTTQKDIYVETFTVKMAEKQPTVVGTDGTASDNDASLQVLKAEIAQLKQQIEQLQSQGTNVAPPLKEKGKPSRPKTKVFTPDISKIFNLLAKATAKDKTIIQDDWRDIVSCLKISQQGKLNSATILAASPTGVLLGFEYEMICQMTSDDAILRQDLREHATRILNHPCDIECIPLSQWQQIREQFVQAKKSGTLNQYIEITSDNHLTAKQDEAQTIEKAEEQLPPALEDEFLEEQEVPDIIKKAVELFGDIVEVEEN